jgi:sugar lactone lactonase YvrE
MNPFARLLSRRAPRPPATRRRTFVPWVEALEGRDVPAHVLVSGLEGSQGSTIGPGGDLYVTETLAGRVSRIDPSTGDVTPIVTGLPTGPFAGVGGGAIDVEFIGRTPYVLVTAVAEDLGGTDVVGIYRVNGPTSFTPIADIGAWSIEHPPATPIFLPTGNQYAMERYRDGFLVTDGHHNRVLQVALDGEITERIAFGNIVPTGLEVRGNTVYMTQAGPIPHLPETGKVVSFGRNATTATEVASGGRLLTDVEFGPGGALYALSQGIWDGPEEGYPALPNTGSLLRVNSDGTFTVLDVGLNQPTSLEFIGHTAYVVGLGGEVVTIDVSRRHVAHVLGGGRALLTDPAGDTFSAAFGLAAVRRADGSADGVVDFSFGPAFGQAWGAVPGVDRIQLHGRITSFTVAADGTVTLEGRLTEKDFDRGRVVFVERDVPFRIVIGPHSTSFSLQWCELPTFYLDVTHGDLRIR